MEERLQKIISACGLMSRRAAEEAIRAGRVAVNGKTAALGDKADPEMDKIEVDGRPLGGAAEPVYLMLNKPAGYVTTLKDEQGRPTAAELVADCGARVYPVGRLDLNSEGLLLFTNDGALANGLEHPSHEVEKEYLVRVVGDARGALPRLSRPMTLDGVRVQGARVRFLGENDGGAALSIVINEGKNRQVRRMCKAAGLHVVRLRRVREGTLRLGELPSGQWRFLTEEELAGLKKLCQG